MTGGVPLRLGRVAFINTYPVEWALSRHLPEGEAVEVTGGQCCERLAYRGVAIAIATFVGAAAMDHEQRDDQARSEEQ